MKFRGVEVNRTHTLLCIISCMLVSGVLTVVQHPMIDQTAAKVLFSFFTGTFVPVIVDWLRETPTTFK